MGDIDNEEPTANDIESLLKIYSIIVEMSDRVSQRRQSANNFYLSVNTAIIGGSAFLTADKENKALWVLGVAGIAICLLWIRNIVSYKTLNEAKFQVIHRLEEKLPTAPYTDEWSILDPNQTGKRHKPFHKTETLVPWVFTCVHVAQITININWSSCLKIIQNALKLTLS